MRKSQNSGKKKGAEVAPPDALVFTIDEAVDRTRLSRASLYRAMDEGRLRFLKYRTRRLIAKEDLSAFISSMRV